MITVQPSDEALAACRDATSALCQARMLRIEATMTNDRMASALDGVALEDVVRAVIDRHPTLGRRD